MESCSPGLLPFRREHGCTHLQTLLPLQDQAPRRAIYTFQLISELTLALRPGDTPPARKHAHILIDGHHWPLSGGLWGVQFRKPGVGATPPHMKFLLPLSPLQDLTWFLLMKLGFP